MFNQRIQQRIQPPPPPPPTPPADGAPSHEEAKKLLDASATTNRNLFIGFNLLLATSLILCLSVSDEQLLLDNTPIPLPFINVSLPTWAFASVLPLFVLVLHFDLLHNLNEHASKLQTWVAAWEKKFPPAPPGSAANAEKVQLSTLLFPFLYDFAWLHAKGRGPDSINRNLLPTLCWLIYCWAPYSVLLIFLIRFADLQSYFYTGWHLLLVGLDVAFLYWYWPRFATVPSPINLKRRHWIKKVINLKIAKWLKIDRNKVMNMFRVISMIGELSRIKKIFNFPMMMLSISTLIAAWSFTLYCLIQIHLDSDLDGLANCVEWAINQERKHKPKFGLTLVPRIVMPDYRIKLAANHFELAEIDTPEKNKAQLWENTATLATLRGRRLGFAVFSGAHMPRVNFENANLKSANLNSAQLKGALLRSAQLQGVDLRRAKLHDAKLGATKIGTTSIPTQLRGAFLSNAELMGADLSDADLKGAVLSDADLKGAVLRNAHLEGADLRNAHLEGADLRNGYLQGSTLRAAHLQGAYLYLAELQGANLRDAHLQGAYMYSAKLQGADLSNARLAGSVLRQAQMQGAFFTDTTQLSAASGWVDWETRFDFSTKPNWLSALSESRQQDAKKQFDQAKQNSEKFATPTLTPNSTQFRQAWLSILCEVEPIAKSMLRHDGDHKLPDEINDAQLRKWLQVNPKCQDYQALAETALDGRKAD